MKKTFFLLFLCFTLFQCKKEPKPSLIGTWETVTTVGFEFEYEITPDLHCRSLPEYFGNTSFCYPYEFVDDSTIVVQANIVETWNYEFVDEDGNVVVVWVTLPDSTKQNFILKRKK